MMDQDRWYVGCTIPRAERIAKMQLDEAKTENCLPLRELKPTLERPINIVPLWPGYIFMRSPQIPERVRAIHKMICTEDGYGIAVPHGVVENLIAKSDHDGILDRYEIEPSWKPKDGDSVRIKYGAYIGYFGLIEWVRGQKLKINFSCFSRNMVLHATLEQVEPA